MKYHDSLNQANVKMMQVIGFLDRCSLPANPINYSVAYEYVGSENQKLMDEINQRLVSDVDIDSYFMEDLYHQLIVGKTEFRDQLVDGMEAILKTVSNSCERSNQSVTRFINSVDRSVDKLPQKESKAISIVIDEIKKATDSVKLSHAKMSAELAKSKIESENLRNELERTKKEMFLDPLTGLFNRKAMNDKTERWFTDNPNKNVSAIVVDIDHFKKFNDKFGHLIGDVILSKVAQQIKSHVGKEDLPVRYGGEEFVVLLPDTEIEAAQQIAETIRQNVSKMKLAVSQSKVRLPQITLSAGVAKKRQNEELNSLFQRADEALYKAKNNGRNQTMLAA